MLEEREKPVIFFIPTAVFPLSKYENKASTRSTKMEKFTPLMSLETEKRKSQMIIILG